MLGVKSIILLAVSVCLVDARALGKKPELVAARYVNHTVTEQYTPTPTTVILKQNTRERVIEEQRRGNGRRQNAASATVPTATCAVTSPMAAYQTTVAVAGQTFVNKGLVGLGVINSDAVDQFGETIGGIGSAIALVRGSWTKTASGTYTGTMIVQPDRGHNTVTTTDYVGRRHFIDFVLTPYYCAGALDYASTARSTFALTYRSSVKYSAFSVPVSGLDALGTYTIGGVTYPVPSPSYTHLSLDAEGLVVQADGTYWVSDEYGPFIYQFDASGALLRTIVPPVSVLPLVGGVVNFNSDTYPDSGRSPNQGFEGLTTNPSGTVLYAFLQSGLVQDGASSAADGIFTRSFSWDITTTPATLLTSYVMQLPVTSGKGKALAVSEWHYLDDTTFMVLSRDGKGKGNTDSDSAQKDFLIYSVASATNIAQTTYTTTTTGVAPGGVLTAGIVAAQPNDFINMIKTAQLTRFGLHNAGAIDATLIDGKWESMAFAPALDPAFPNDYFLFSFADNDFITLNGYSVGAAYSDPYGVNVDNQALVWRVTLPTSGADDSN